jgi:hypothetical protein
VSLAVDLAAGRVDAALAALSPMGWPVLRLPLVVPWQEQPGIRSEDTPEWIRMLGTIATIAHMKDHPFGRRPATP